MTTKTWKAARVLFLGSAVVFCNPATAAEDSGKFTLTTGLDYSSGEYGDTEKTEITSIPLIARYETGRWAFKATVPYIRITGPGNVVPSLGQIGETQTRRRTTESGLGDTTVSATYNLFQGGNGMPVVDLTGKVKLATADEDKGLGTGEHDYATQLDIYKGFGKFTAIATLGYRVYGNPSFVDLDNVFYGSVGGAYKVGANTSVGVIYDYRPRIAPGGSHVSEAVAFVSHTLSDSWKAQAYLVRGFSDGSPDIGGGALVSFMF